MYDAKRYQGERAALLAEIEGNRTPEQIAEANRIRWQRAEFEALPGGQKTEMEELDVFSAFAEVAELGVDAGSEAKAVYPEPDVRCTIAGSAHYFELAQIADPRVARADSITENVSAAVAFSPTAPFDYIVEKKRARAKNYATGGAPMDLVLYYRKQHAPPLAFFEVMVADRQYAIKALVAPGLFHRFWVFDFVKRMVLLRTDRWHSGTAV